MKKVTPNSKVVYLTLQMHPDVSCPNCGLPITDNDAHEVDDGIMITCTGCNFDLAVAKVADSIDEAMAQAAE